MSLAHYRAVVYKKRLPFWKQSKLLTVADDFSLISTEQLWKLHDELIRSLHSGKGSKKRTSLRENRSSLLDLKLELTRRIYKSCTLCPLSCRVDRLSGEVGRCGLAKGAWVFREGLLVSEEPFVIPTHELFFSGCNMGCKFCQAWEGVVQTKVGIEFTPNWFAQLVELRKSQGAVNIHFVGGEPTVNLLATLEGLRALEIPLPLVWNTNLFATDEAMKLLDGIVDLFIADFKFGNDKCAWSIGGVEDYVATIQSNLVKASKIASLVVRHLVMPDHIDCCLKPVVFWISENLPDETFHLMLNYVPDWKAWGEPSLCRRLTEAEKEWAKEIVKAGGFKKMLVTE
ncbi:MAG: radical SAM protein [Armatimonadetes bacterium]|nr:radical SAM protein [Armatimonadota bacterium]MCX7967334.1 radical SAM protein [Armatimonadota bacterium]MDW8142514.1 radical SAM protein [Armatimonadota bacterium]